MNLPELISKYENALVILKELEQKQVQLSDFNKRLEIERNKPLIESFLVAGEKWYLEQIEKTDSEIQSLWQKYFFLLNTLLVC
jgi:hypothetical protein